MSPCTPRPPVIHVTNITSCRMFVAVVTRPPVTRIGEDTTAHTATPSPRNSALLYIPVQPASQPASQPAAEPCPYPSILPSAPVCRTNDSVLAAAAADGGGGGSHGAARQRLTATDWLARAKPQPSDYAQRRSCRRLSQRPSSVRRCSACYAEVRVSAIVSHRQPRAD